MYFSIVQSHNFNGEKLCSNGKMLLMSPLKWEEGQHHKDIRGHYKNYLCAILKSDEEKMCSRKLHQLYLMSSKKMVSHFLLQGPIKLLAPNSKRSCNT